VTKVVKNLWSATILSTVLAWSGTVSAATVVIVRPSSPSARVTEALTFLHGELSSVGLEDRMIERLAPGTPTGTDMRPWLEQLAREQDAIAVVDIVGDDRVVAVDVWVLKSPGRFEVTRVAVDPDTVNSSVRLAIRALEALHASLLEVDFAARNRRAKHTAKPHAALPPRSEPSQLTSDRERFGLEVGAASLMSPGGVGPAVLPVGRLNWAVRSWLVLQATLAGLGTRPSVTTTVGTARVAREYAVLGGSCCLEPNHRWWPVFSIAAGVLHTSAEGQNGIGMDRHAVGQWSLLIDAGLGAGIRLYRSYYLTLAGHVQLAQPYVAIHFGDPVSATTGRPNLLVPLTVGAWL
jgi:hypothetical protein